MPQKEDHIPSGENISIPDSFSGFVATYEDGVSVLEREGYHSEKTRRLMATSWPEVDTEKLASVTIYWNGQKKHTVSKSDHPHMKPQDWFFSQTGYMDIKRHTVLVVARNLGYRGNDNLLHIVSIQEEDGSLKGIVRA